MHTPHNTNYKKKLLYIYTWTSTYCVLHTYIQLVFVRVCGFVSLFFCFLLTFVVLRSGAPYRMHQRARGRFSIKHITNISLLLRRRDPFSKKLMSCARALFHRLVMAAFRCRFDVVVTERLSPACVFADFPRMRAPFLCMHYFAFILRTCGYRTGGFWDACVCVTVTAVLVL